MGTKINELVKEVRRTITFENLLNKRIAIDAFNTIYQFLAIIRQRDGTPLKDYNGNVTSHLSGLFYRSINFLEHNIKPIFVFDGVPSELKLETIKERRKIKEVAKEKMVKAQEKEDFGEAPLMNSYQFDSVFEDGALWKHGNLAQGIYIDPARDFVGVYFSTNGYIPPYGEDKMPGFLRRAAKTLAGGRDIH